MKFIVKNYFTKQPQRIISALALTSILSLSTGLTLLQAAAAASINQQAKKDEIRPIQLPNTVANTVRRDLSRRTGIPAEKWKITKFSRKTWPNGCLGLGRADEVCTQALVEGWQITLSDGSQTWSYRTDSEGLVLRLEPVENYGYSNLPKSVADAVLRAVSKQSGLPISELRIRPASAQQRIWSDGCLGLGARAELCLQALVPGWLVTVEGKQKCLVYRTNASGSQVKLDKSASLRCLVIKLSIFTRKPLHNEPVQPVPISNSELSPPLKKGVIFQVIASYTNYGGLSGTTYETKLFNDGRVIWIQTEFVGYGTTSQRTTSQPETYQVSEQQVQKFLKVLEQQQFAQFKNLAYQDMRNEPHGFFSFTSSDGTIAYTDITEYGLPSSLKAVIQAWGKVLSGIAL